MDGIMIHYTSTDQARKSSMDQTEQIYRCIKSFKQKYGYVPPFRHIAYKLNLRQDVVRKAVKNLKQCGKIVVKDEMGKSTVEIVD